MITLKELAESTDPAILKGLGALRRMAVTLTAKALWQLTGFRYPDGTTETLSAEPFTGIGIAARPPTNGKPEAIAVMVGGSKSPAVVAVRDEKTRGAVAGAIAEDETMLFNSKAVVYAKADGTIEARSAAGAALALATKADLDALANWIHSTMIVTTPGAGPSTPGTTNPPPAATGTTKLKGE